MATLNAKKNPKSRVDAGNAVIEAGATVSTAPVKARFAAFAKTHKDYCAAEAKAKKAGEAARAQEALIGELDDAQDALVLDLAARLAGDGLPRANPFKALGFAAPSAICATGTAKEAKIVLALVKKAMKHPGAGARSKATAARAAQAASKVDAAMKPLEILREAHHAAITRRDALAVPWEKAFSSLKRAARSAADDGHTALYEALFVSTARAPSPPKAKSNGVPATPPG